MTWLKVMDHISIIFIEQDVYLLFSPVWKYCFVTQERINSSFCTERGIIGHLGAHWEERQKCIWDCCLQWFQFYRDGYGWLAQGERSSLENKGRLTFMAAKKKKEKKKGDWGAVWESFYLSVRVKIYDLSFFLSSLASHLPLHHSSSHFAFLSHHTISRSSSSPQKKHPSDRWQSGIYVSANRHRYKHTPHNPTQLSCCVCFKAAILPVAVRASASSRFLLLFFCMSLVFHPLLPHL